VPSAMEDILVSKPAVAISSDRPDSMRPMGMNLLLLM